MCLRVHEIGIWRQENFLRATRTRKSKQKEQAPHDTPQAAHEGNRTAGLRRGPVECLRTKWLVVKPFEDQQSQDAVVNKLVGRQ